MQHGNNGCAFVSIFIIKIWKISLSIDRHTCGNNIWPIKLTQIERPENNFNSSILENSRRYFFVFITKEKCVNALPQIDLTETSESQFSYRNKTKKIIKIEVLNVKLVPSSLFVTIKKRIKVTNLKAKREREKIINLMCLHFVWKWNYRFNYIVLQIIIKRHTKLRAGIYK